MCPRTPVLPQTGGPGPAQTTSMTDIGANRAHRQAFRGPLSVEELLVKVEDCELDIEKAQARYDQLQAAEARCGHGGSAQAAGGPV